VANWARYHASPYTYTVDQLAPVAGKLQEVSYSFLYFCPPPNTSPMPYWAVAPYGNCDNTNAWQLLSVEPADAANLATLAGFKASNPALKIVLSIGG
jgi:GH18 family chitinase